MPSNYEEAINWLFQQFPSYQQIGAKAYKPTLENTNRLLSALDLDTGKLQFIHIAGSNGKGTVSSLIASILKESGYRTGLFTSPHIKDFSERIRIDGKTIDDGSVVNFVDDLRDLKIDFEPSFFEISFVMAIRYFMENQCDICVIETGLGGRLDSTNVIHPLLSVITTISLEHVQFLGNTTVEIASEKAGIIKNGVPVIIGEGAQNELVVFQSAAQQNNAPLYLVSKDQETGSYKLPFLPRSYQIENLRTVLKAVEVLRSIQYSITEATIQKGLDHLKENSGYIGRLQIVQNHPKVIFDASHNPEGITATLKTIKDLWDGELRIIYGTSADKDLSTIVNLFPKNANYYITEFSNKRSAGIESLKNAFDGKNLHSVCYFKDPVLALESAKKESSENDLILVLGSFFLLEHFF